MTLLFKPQCCLHCQKISSDGKTCPQCLKTTSLDFYLSPLSYGKTCKILIKQIKYQGRFALFKELKTIITRFVQKKMSELNDFTLVPIPLHITRFRFRGFNQSEKICHFLAADCNLPINMELIRHKKTIQQAKQCRSMRFENLHKAFSIKATSILPKKIILVDDVCSTGATLISAAKTIRDHFKNDEKVIIGAFTITHRLSSAILQKKVNHDHRN